MWKCFCFFVCYAGFLAPAFWSQGPASNAAYFDQFGFPTEANPRAVEFADLDGNGLLDTLIADESNNGIQVRLKTGSSAYRNALFLEPGQPFEDVDAGDMNNDGKLDIVALSGATPSMLFVEIGDGTGAFVSSVRVASSGTGEALALADIDGDGNLDVLEAQSDLGTLAVFLGLGDGTLSPEVSFAAEPLANDLDVGDFDNDGRLDVISATSLGGSIVVLRGDGSGGFSRPNILPALNSSEARLGDLDNDGDLDMVGVSQTNKYLAVFENLDGEFQTFVRSTIQAPGIALELTDWDVDGNLDAVVGFGAGSANNFSPFLASVLFGDGMRTFSSMLFLSSNSGRDKVEDLALGDLDQDGVPDLGLALPPRDSVLLLLSDGPGGIHGPRFVPTSINPTDFRMGDMNGDGFDDLVVATKGGLGGVGEGLGVGLGDGTGTFGTMIQFGGPASGLELGEFTSDGILDAVFTRSGEQLCIAAGVGDGSLLFSDCLNTITNIADFAIGDINGDGKTDAVSTHSSTGIFLVSRGDGEGVLLPEGTSVLLGGSPNAVALEDLDLDGDLDAVVVDDSPGNYQLIILQNDGFGDFSLRSDIGLPVSSPGPVASADLNRDGWPDLVTAGYDTVLKVNTGLVYYGLGSATFSAPLLLPTEANALLSIGDVNRDGWPDIGFNGSNLFSVAINDCVGGFAIPYAYLGESRSTGFALRDIDGDKRGEVLLLRTSADAMTIYENLAPSEARALTRNGSGVNPQVFSSLTAPILGTTWTSVVNTSAFPATTTTALFGYDRGLPGLSTILGELLVAPEPIGILLLSSLQPVLGGISTHDVTIPMDTALIGTFVTTQAALLGSSPVLCNAIDLLLGDS